MSDTLVWHKNSGLMGCHFLAVRENLQALAQPFFCQTLGCAPVNEFNTESNFNTEFQTNANSPGMECINFKAASLLSVRTMLEYSYARTLQRSNALRGSEA